ncbi:MAG: RNA methyltransferase [Phycisphaerales bacterium]
MQVQHIDDPADPRLEPYRSVRDRDTLGRDGHPGRFIGESPLVIEAMLRAPIRTLSILTAPRHAERAVALVGEAGRADSPDAPQVLVAPDAVLDGVVGFHIHRGFLAVGERPALPTAAELIARACAGASAGGDAATRAGALLLCIESCNNIDNIGQLFRNAAAFGCAGVLLSPDCHDPLYRKSLRVSCGCVLRVPYAWSADWEGDLRTLRETHAFALVGASGGAERTLAECARELAERAPAARRTALLVGAEYAGLRAPTLAACTHRARIPMAPGVDSLNVAVAAAVFLDRLREAGDA